MKPTLALFCSLPFLCAVASMGCSSSSTTPKTDLGIATAGAYTAHVYIEGAGVTAGAPSRMVMVVTGGMPTAITGWIGTASGEGSVKKAAVFDSGDGDYDIDLVSPTPLPADAKFWFETDTSGKKDVGSLPFAK